VYSASCVWVVGTASLPQGLQQGREGTVRGEEVAGQEGAEATEGESGPVSVCVCVHAQSGEEMAN